MEYVSGNIFIRTNGVLEKADDVIVGHRHHFGHTTFCLAGELELSLLRESEVNAFDQPVKAEIEEQWVLRPDMETPWQYILPGRFHMLRAVVPGTRYLCVYSHQYPQALSVGKAGQLPTPANTKRDEHGDLWIRVNENIVQVTSEWSERHNR